MKKTKKNVHAQKGAARKDVKHIGRERSGVNSRNPLGPNSFGRDMGGIMKEQRRSQRKPLAVLLQVCSFDNCKQLGKGFVTNLSEQGLALETTERLRTGEKFLLRFRLLNGWDFDVVGRIVYAKGGVFTNAYGVQFSKIHPEASAKIKHYVMARIGS